jgi:hypothetical protein
VKVRFQADADLNQTILLAAVRKEPGIDFRDAREAALRGVADPEVLARAAAAGRLLVTHDAKTMPGELGRFVQTTDSPGLTVVPQHLPISKAAEELILIWAATDAEEWVNRICWLPL